MTGRIIVFVVQLQPLHKLSHKKNGFNILENLTGDLDATNIDLFVISLDLGLSFSLNGPPCQLTIVSSNLSKAC